MTAKTLCLPILFILSLAACQPAADFKGVAEQSSASAATTPNKRQMTAADYRRAERFLTLPLNQTQGEALFLDVLTQESRLKIIRFWNQRLKRNSSKWQKGNEPLRIVAASSTLLE